jgi:RNA polymerase sigma factor (sigma-70 family)
LPEFSELLRRVRVGDGAAVAELYEVYRERVSRVAHRGLGSRLKSRYDTADITQSVFGDMLRELPAFEDRGERAFHAWLLTKVRHKLASKARRQTSKDGRVRERRLDTEPGLAGSADDPQDAAGLADDTARLTTLLGGLDPERRAVIGLFLDQGLSWDEIARRLSLPSAAAARMRYVRAVAALRDRWTQG